jgi:hypothetical protein
LRAERAHGEEGIASGGHHEANRAITVRRRNYLLLWVAVLFVIFQTQLILTKLWKSIHSWESSRSKLT